MSGAHGANTVWLASYPKSGNTWFRAVHAAWRTGTQVQLDHLDVDGTYAGTAWREQIDAELGIVSSLLTDDEINAVRPRVAEIIDARSTGLHLRKTHQAYELGPLGEPVVSSAATKCALYFVRDPRDVAVSFAHHLQRSHAFTVQLLADTDGAIGPDDEGGARVVGEHLGTWSEHVRGWLDTAPFPVLSIRYEDCTTDPVGVFGAALRFAGLEPDDGNVGSAVASARFDRLQSQEAGDGFRERPVGINQFFRRGVAGGWREELAPALAQQIATDHQLMMDRLGYR